ncbi:MAG: hypothetical protein GY774_29690 [Planctomycetes bacterium]|nr:hypothetical protein [Planctomycetota bacterium]
MANNEGFLWNLEWQDSIIKAMLLNMYKSCDDMQSGCLQGDSPSNKGHSTGVVSQVFVLLW